MATASTFPPSESLWTQLRGGVKRAVIARGWRAARGTFSHDAEDIILSNLLHRLGRTKNLTYVDVGANDPMYSSNTYAFYQRGGRGVLVEPDQKVATLLRKWRPRDEVFACAIGAEEGVREFMRWEISEYNSFADCKTAEEIELLKKTVRLVGVSPMQVKPLAQVLGESTLAAQPIDFINVDVEGGEMDVLTSNDWRRWRPSVLAVEIHDKDITKIQDNAVVQYLANLHYRLIAKTLLTAIFADERELAKIDWT